MKAPPTSNLLFHPAFLLAFIVLGINDHYLKLQHPGWLSGKLSDLAFMVAAPLWLFICATSCLERCGLAQQARSRILLLCIGLIGAFFVSMQLTAWGDYSYRFLLGLLKWPFVSFYSYLSTGQGTALRLVQATPDPSDLLTLPFLYVAWRVGKAWFPRPGTRPTTQRASLLSPLLLALVLSTSSTAQAAAPQVDGQNNAVAQQNSPESETRNPGSSNIDDAADNNIDREDEEEDDFTFKDRHHGFFVGVELQAAAFFMRSNANMLSGLEQLEPSSSSALGGGVEAQVGGSLSPHWALSGYLAVNSATQLRVRVFDQVVRLKSAFLHSGGTGLGVTYFPQPGSGWFGALRTGFIIMEGSNVPITESGDWGRFETLSLAGPELGLAAGKQWQLVSKLWAGLTLKLKTSYLSGENGVKLWMLSPQVAANLSWF